MERTTVLLPSGTASYLESSGHGRTFLFVHGNSSSARAFAPLLTGPLGQAARCIAVDLPGHGLSYRSHDPGSDYTLAGYGRFLRTFCEALALERVVVVGWSLGGHAALEVVEQLPIEHLVLMGTPPLGSIADASEAFLPEPAASAALIPALTEQQIADWTALFVAPGNSVPLDVIDDVRATDPAARGALAASLVGNEFRNELEIVRTLAVPLTILHGSHERLVSRSYLLGLDAPTLVDGVRIIPDAGHLLVQEQPGTVARLLHAISAGTTPRARVLGDTLRWYNDVWSRGVTGLIPEIRSELSVAHGLSGNDLVGTEPFVELVRNLRGAMPDLHFDVHASVVDGDRTGNMYAMHGTHTGAGLGVPPTGHRVSLVGMAMCRYENGRIVESWNTFDFLQLFSQIDAAGVPAPAVLSNPVPSSTVARETLAGSTRHATAPSAAVRGAVEQWLIDACATSVATDIPSYDGLMTGVRAFIGDLTVEVDDLLIDGIWAMARVTYHGRTPNGPASFGAMHLLQLNDRTVTNIWTCIDAYELTRQAGIDVGSPARAAFAL